MAGARRPRRMIRIRPYEVSLVKSPANGEDVVLLKSAAQIAAEAEAASTKPTTGSADLAALAKQAAAPRDEWATFRRMVSW